MAFLRRELIGGLALIVGVIGLVESHLAVTPLVLALLAFGGLWTAVVVIHALLMRRRNAGYPANQESPSLHRSQHIKHLEEEGIGEHEGVQLG